MRKSEQRLPMLKREFVGHMTGIIGKIAIFALSVIQISLAQSVNPYVLTDLSANKEIEPCNTEDTAIAQFTTSNSNYISAIDIEYSCFRTDSGFEKDLAASFSTEADTACSDLNSPNCIASSQADKVLSTFEHKVKKALNVVTQCNHFFYGSMCTEISNQIESQISSLKNSQSTVTKLISKPMRRFKCLDLDNLNEQIRSLNSEIWLFSSHCNASIFQLNEFGIGGCIETSTISTIISLCSATPSAELMKRDMFRFKPYTTTQTNKGITCKPDDDLFHNWYSANQEVIVVLKKIVDWAGPFGPVDTRSLATSLVDALNSARIHLEQFRCLVPTQVADLYAGISQIIGSFTTTLSKLKKTAATDQEVANLVRFMVLDGIEALNSYIGSFSSLLQDYYEDYPCSDITTINNIIRHLNDMLNSVSSDIGISGPPAIEVHVTNCYDPKTTTTTTTTTLPPTTSSAKTSSRNTFSTKVSSSVLTTGSGVSFKSKSLPTASTVSSESNGVSTSSGVSTSRTSTMFSAASKRSSSPSGPSMSSRSSAELTDSGVSSITFSGSSVSSRSSVVPTSSSVSSRSHVSPTQSSVSSIASPSSSVSSISSVVPTSSSVSSRGSSAVPTDSSVSSRSSTVLTDSGVSSKSNISPTQSSVSSIASSSSGVSSKSNVSPTQSSASSIAFSSSGVSSRSSAVPTDSSVSSRSSVIPTSSSVSSMSSVVSTNSELSSRSNLRPYSSSVSSKSYGALTGSSVITKSKDLPTGSSVTIESNGGSFTSSNIVRTSSNSGDPFPGYSGLSTYSTTVTSAVTSTNGIPITRVSSKIISTSNTVTSAFVSSCRPLSPTTRGSVGKSSKYPNITSTTCDVTYPSFPAPDSQMMKTSRAQLTTYTRVVFSSTGSFIGSGNTHTSSGMNPGSSVNTNSKYEVPSGTGARTKTVCWSANIGSSKNTHSSGVPPTRTGGDTISTNGSITRPDIGSTFTGYYESTCSKGTTMISGINEVSSRAFKSGHGDTLATLDASTVGNNKIPTSSSTHIVEGISTITAVAAPKSDSGQTHLKSSSNGKVMSTTPTSSYYLSPAGTTVEASTVTTNIAFISAVTGQSHGIASTSISDRDASYSRSRGGADEARTKNSPNSIATSPKATGFDSSRSYSVTADSGNLTPTAQNPSPNGSSSAPSSGFFSLSNAARCLRPRILSVGLSFVAIVI